MADEGWVTDRIDFADDVDGCFFRIDPDENVFQAGPDEAVGAAHESIIFVGRIDPMRPVTVRGDGRGDGFGEKDLAVRHVYAIKDTARRTFWRGGQAKQA